MQNQCRSVEAGLFLDMYLESPATKPLFGIHISWFADRCDFFLPARPSVREALEVSSDIEIW